MKRVLPFLLAAAVTPCADAQNVGDTVSGLIDFRVGAASGETSWLDGGFGKLGLGGEDDLDVRIARGALAWRPHLTFSTDVYVQLEFDPEQEDAVGVGEAFLRYKPMPVDDWRFSVRVGAFYPPISLEHDGAAWSTTRTLTPSAINSWIGEEVKVGGAEASVTRPVGRGEITLTGAAFGYNDTAGTLLTFRGWALHDHQTMLGGGFPLPTRSDAWWSYRPNQAHVAEPTREIDGRVGVYARAEWKPDAPISVAIFHYDNLGDARTLEDLQTSWDTSFTNISVAARLDDQLVLLAQAMSGETYWIPLPNGPVPYVDDVDFRSAYVLLDRSFGDDGVAARLEAFETTDRNQDYSLNSTPEAGWALTGTYRNQLRPGLTFLIEGAYVDSKRDARGQVGQDPQQSQLQVQSALRVAF